MKEQPLMKWAKDNNRNHTVLGLRTAEGGRRALRGKCQSVIKGQYKFSPLIKVTDEWEEWFIDKYKVELCDLYKEPYNFDRTGCKGCPFTIDLQQQLNTMEEKLPAERKQCEIIWKPVYEEYRRIGYRLDKDDGQMSIFDFIGGR